MGYDKKVFILNIFTNVTKKPVKSVTEKNMIIYQCVIYC